MGNVLGIQISCDAIFSGCLNCTFKKAAYVSQLEENLVALQTQLQKLVEAKKDLMTRVINAEHQQMRRLNQVQGWISRVEAVETEVGELITHSSQEIQKLCLGGYCSKNCKSSYKFGKTVARKLQLVATLTGEGDFEVVAERVYEPEAAVDEIICEPTIVGMDSIFEEVWRSLGDESVGIIGIYGLGGVGKTTLLTQINNKFIHMPKNFDFVIWVVASKDLQVEKIQEEIGKKIGLFDESWKNKSCKDKASDIFKNLRKKTFILLLDDIWERVDLIKVGVPIPSPNITSKVVFTTRSLDVCGLMEADKKFQVKCLNDKEAWELFQNKVGKDTLNSHPDIPNLAKTAAKECGGLPLALKTIGRAMACRKTPEEWRHAIQLLKRSNSKVLGMEKEVYPLLKFSYDSLPNDQIRSCLLYCSLFPEDYWIQKKELIDCWIGEGILDETDSSAMQDEGYYIIGVLAHACLLEEIEYGVKMHDVIRDMCLWIACEIEKEKENFLVRAGAGLIEAPEIEKWEGLRRVSLMNNQIENLSEIPDCPGLLTLILQSNELKLINNDFFKYMHSLRVLNLSYNSSLTILPSGILNLVSLQYLALSYTEIEVLPKELRSLANLRCLNLDYTTVLGSIPRHLISSFAKLQVLRMFHCGSSISNVIREDSVLFGGGELLMEELLGLKYLNVLAINVTSCQALQRFLSSQKFQRCTQELSLCWFDDSKSFDVLCLADLKHLEHLHIFDCKLLEELKIGYRGEVQMARQPHDFHSLGFVSISRCCKLRDLTWLVFAQNLKQLSTSDCSDMEEIINVGKLDEGLQVTVIANLEPFTKLGSLFLWDLPNLKRIYSKALPFPHLNVIQISQCPLLKKLPLDSNSAKQRKIKIRGYEDWWKKLQWEDQDTQNAFLPFFQEVNPK